MTSAPICGLHPFYFIIIIIYSQSANAFNYKRFLKKNVLFESGFSIKNKLVCLFCLIKLKKKLPNAYLCKTFLRSAHFFPRPPLTIKNKTQAHIHYSYCAPNIYKIYALFTFLFLAFI